MSVSVTTRQGSGAMLEQRVVRAAEAALASRQFVSAIDVLVGIGWLAPSHVEEWRQGRVEYLERVSQANLAKLSGAMKVFRAWARSEGLEAKRRRLTEHQNRPADLVVVSQLKDWTCPECSGS